MHVYSTCDHLEDRGVDGRIIQEWIFQELGWKVVDYIALAEDRDRCRAPVNAVMNFRAL